MNEGHETPTGRASKPTELSPPRLGDFKIVQTLLGRILQEKRDSLRSLLSRKGIPKVDFDEVIHEAYLKLIKMELDPRISRVVSDAREGSDEGAFYGPLCALLLHCLKYYASNDYMKRRFKHPTEPLESERTPCMSASEEQREFLLSLYPQIVVDIEGFIRHDESVTEKFYDDLANVAGLNERERAFVLFMARNSSAREQDFCHDISGATITRIKQRAYAKIVGFLAQAGAACGEKRNG